MFGHSWEDGTATIVDARVKKTTGDGMVSIREFVADVCVPGGQPFRCVMQEPTIATDFWPPSIGAVVKARVDVKRGEAKFDKSDPQISAKAQERARRDAFAATAAAPPMTDPRHNATRSPDGL